MNPAKPSPPVTRRLPARQRSRASWIVGSYAVFATLWIYLSDRLLGLMVTDPEQLVRWSVYKGLAFIAITSALLLVLIRRVFGAMETGYASLQAQQAEIERLNRLYSALVHLNQAIVKAARRDELFQRTCQVLVQNGGFSLAWIGWNDPTTHRLVPVAVTGDENDYIRNIQVYTDDRPEGRGPSGATFQSGRPHICHDMLADPSTLPWRAEIERRGFRSSAALPIRLGGKVAGVLSVYSNSVGFFQDRELSLLEEAANDVSFALGNLAREEERQQAEVRAGNERRFSSTLLESMPGIVYLCDAEGRFLRWNRNFEVISGCPAEEIAQMRLLDFFAEGDRPLLKERIAEIFTQGESSVEAALVGKNGRSTPCFFTGRRVVFEGKICLVGMGIDVSERQQANDALRRSEEQFRLIMDNLTDLVAVIDLDGRRIYNSPSYREILGDPVKLRGSLSFEQIHPEDQARVRQAFQETVHTGVGHRLEYRLVDQHGRPRHIESQGSVIRDMQGRVVQVVVVSRDVTERRRTEMALRVLNQTLELEVANRTAELQTALVRTEAADQIKSAFLATMSHELRTPLNSIIGFTGIVLQGLAGPLNPEQTKQLGMVRSSARHLLELINDVLDISKIEAGQLEVHAESFDLSALIDRVVTSVKPLAEKKGLALLTSVPQELKEMVSDRRRVEQILLNLVNNALKFTHQGRVTLTVELVPDFQPSPEAQPCPAVQVRVADTGIGIKPDDLALLFQPFRQLDTGLTRHHEGTGLGLAICRRLAGLLGGEISARSEWQHGSEFTVVLPLRIQSKA